MSKAKLETLLQDRLDFWSRLLPVVQLCNESPNLSWSAAIAYRTALEMVKQGASEAKILAWLEDCERKQNFGPCHAEVLTFLKTGKSPWPEDLFDLPRLQAEQRRKAQIELQAKFEEQRKQAEEERLAKIEVEKAARRAEIADELGIPVEALEKLAKGKKG